jgi:hypothetical protein
MEPVLMPSLIWGVLSIWGSVLISVVSNVGGILTKKQPFKLVGRGDRGLIIWVGLILGLIKPVFFSYSIILITILSHITVIVMLIEYSIILKKEEKNLSLQQGHVSSSNSVETQSVETQTVEIQTVETQAYLAH